MRARELLLGASLLLGCSRGGGGPDPAGAFDLAVGEDAGGADLQATADLRPGPDLVPAPDLAAPPDMAWSPSATVDIFVDNFCRMDVVPKSFTVPAGAVLKITYRNRSVDYPVDVWLSYGGGFLDLKQGMSWLDRFEHCSGPLPSTAWADISTACSRYRLTIRCL